MSQRQQLAAENRWRLRKSTSFSMARESGGVFCLSGQLDLDEQGIVRSPGDLRQQTIGVFARLEGLVAHVGATVDDVAKLVVYYLGAPDFDVLAYKRWLATLLPASARPVISLVPVTGFFYSGLTVQVDCYGVVGGASRRRSFGSEVAGFPQAVCYSGVLSDTDTGANGNLLFVGGLIADDEQGRLQFANDVVSQSQLVLEKLDRVLDHFGGVREDIAKINNWYAGSDDASVWAQSAKVRAAWYPEPGPVATGIPLPWMLPTGCMIQTDCWILSGSGGQSLPRQHSWPQGHWDWPVHLPFKHGLRCANMVFTGGQVSMNSTGEVVDGGDIRRQSQTSMNNIERVLAEFDVSMADIIKVNAFFVGNSGNRVVKDGRDMGEDSDELFHQSLAIRSARFESPGPATSHVALDNLAYPNMLTEFEVIAICQNQKSLS